MQRPRSALESQKGSARDRFEVDFLNIKQVRYFVAVFQSGSLSAAAKEQYVTVQAVSKAIADLERELKNELFVRESRGVHPTLFGKAFYVKTEPVLRSFDELEAFAHRRRSAESPLLRLGLCASPLYGLHRSSTRTRASKPLYGLRRGFAASGRCRRDTWMRLSWLAHAVTPIWIA